MTGMIVKCWRESIDSSYNEAWIAHCFNWNPTELLIISSSVNTD